MAANWQQVRRVFDGALRQAPDKRQNYINEACGANKALLTEVESLFSSLDKSDEFLEKPAVAHIADLIEPRSRILEPGKRFGHYQVIQQIGTGGMGEVYLAQDHKLDRHVAIKILDKDSSRDGSNLKRFVGEAKAASALNHPNILVIHEIGESEDADYIVSEFIEGRTLRDVLTQPQMSLAEVLDVVIQIAGALSAAHGARLVHRDIKPENVMLRPDGYVKVLDFGLAKLVEPENKAFSGLQDSTANNQTARGVILGTVNYMSPEQAKGERVDERTDIFSLGVVLYEMIAGQAPFAGDSMAETLANLINAEPQPLSRFAGSVPDEMQHILLKMLCKDKGQRYQTMKDVLTDLRDLRANLISDEKLERSASPEKRSETEGLQATTDGANLEIAETQYSLSQKINQHKSLAALALATLLIGSIGLFLYFFSARNRAVRADDEQSIAVLPFVNVSGDPNAEYLSEGISDSIIVSLSRLPNLKVKSLSAVLGYKGQQIDSQKVGRELNVRAVLRGRMTQRGDDVTISAELVDVSDNRLLWEEQYTRKLADILVVQNEIALQISNGLRLRLSGEDKKQLAKQYTQDTDAYLLYSLGRYYDRQNTKQGFEKAIESFEQAIELDPDYALAYANLASTYHFMGTRGFSTTKDTEQRVERAALRALQLDDTLAEGHALLGVNKYNNFDWVGAEKALERALELDPKSSSAHFVVFGYMIGQGRLDEGLQYVRRAHELDPTRSSGELAFAYFLARQYDKAIELYRKNLVKLPNDAHSHILLGEAYVAKGMPAEGLAEMQKGIALDATVAKTPARWDRYPLLAYAYAMAGRRDDALKILKQQQRLAKQGYVSPYNFLIIYTGLGDKDQAFAWLRQCIEQRTRPLWQLRGRPMFDPLRSDPRYAGLLRKMNLEP